MIFHCVHILHFLLSIGAQWSLCYCKAAINMAVELLDIITQLPLTSLVVGKLNYMAVVFCFWGSSMLFSVDCTSLYPHEHGVRVPHAPHSCQLLSLFLVVVLTIAILAGVRWSCHCHFDFISMMLFDVEHCFTYLLVVCIYDQIFELAHLLFSVELLHYLIYSPPVFQFALYVGIWSNISFVKGL